MEILQQEWQILNVLFHPELFESVVVETGLPSTVARDILLTLVHYNYVFVENFRGKRLPMFDKDALNEVRFSMTAKGVKAWENFKAERGL